MQELDDSMLERYAQHVIIDKIGETGQLRLLKSRILIVGMGGLGSPVALYLAAAGIGMLGLVDHDVVSLSNLQRQIIHSDDDLGRAKIVSAIEKIKALRPDIKIESHRIRLIEHNVFDLTKDYDLIIDATDNFSARSMLSRACLRHQKTMVSAALSRFEGQLTSWKPGQYSDDGTYLFPCYQCIFPKDAVPNHLARCDRVGVLSPLVGVFGSLQAVEAIKELLGIGTSLAGSLLLFDALTLSWRRIAIHKNTRCSICTQP